MIKNICFLLSGTLAVVSDWYPDAFPEPKTIGTVWSFSTRGTELHSLETPQAIYIPMKVMALQWMCTAIHSANFHEPVNFAAPIYRAPEPEEFHNTYARIMCWLYARAFFIPEVFSETVHHEHMMHMMTYGLYDNRVSDEGYQEIYKCVDGGEEGCIDTLADQYYPMTEEPLDLFAFTGAFAAAWIVRSMNNDRWNHNGRWTRTGESCTHSVNCRPFEDYTGYVPVNGPHNIYNETRWMPLVESDGTGFFYTQEHVTPQLKAVDGQVGTADQMSRTVDNPNYDYLAEMELVYERVASVTDEEIALIALMDSKLLLISAMMMGIDDHHPLGFEENALFALGFQFAEHDATVNTWREKVRHDLIRPTSVSHYMVPEKNVTWFDGTTISTSQWQPLIRVMPHAEYPSGSSAICRVTADFAQLYVENILGWENLATTWTMEAGGAPSKFVTLKGYPKEDHEVTFNTLDELSDMCSRSRLLGGMHFTASTQAGEDIVDGIGQKAWEAVQSLLNEDDVPAIEMDESRMNIEVTETVDEGISCISSDDSWMLKFSVAFNILLSVLVICLFLFVRKIFLEIKDVKKVGMVTNI